MFLEETEASKHKQSNIICKAYIPPTNSQEWCPRKILKIQTENNAISISHQKTEADLNLCTSVWLWIPKIHESKICQYHGLHIPDTSKDQCMINTKFLGANKISLMRLQVINSMWFQSFKLREFQVSADEQKGK